ncbi:MAG: DUF3667 domain-containing protein [Bacteroidota bacterium]
MANKPTIFSKGRYALKYRGTECLNCGHPLDMSDKFCPNCGQANSTKKLVLKDFFDEFFHNLINYDSKLLKTLYSLLIKPGTITKDYIAGKRMSYTNPFRFLLSLAFLYFLLFNYNSSFLKLDRKYADLDKKIDNSRVFDFDLNLEDSDTLDIGNQEAIPLKGLDSLRNVNPKFLEGLKIPDTLKTNSLGSLKASRDSLILSNPKSFLDSIESGSSGFSKILKKVDFFIVLIRKDSVMAYEDAVERHKLPSTRMNRATFNIGDSVLRALSRPGSYLNTTIAKVPFVIFFFLPVFTGFIWLVYIRKNYTYTDHLIFSFHNQSLLFILLLLSLLIDTLIGTQSSFWFLLIFGIYLYKAMRKFYGQGRFKTILKYIFLNTIFAFLAFFTVLLLFAGSAFTY